MQQERYKQRYSKKQRDIHRNYRYYCWNIKSKKMSREELPFRECPSSVKEFSYKNNWRVFINGVEHHIRWQSRCLLENIDIKVYTAEKQKQQTNQWNRWETRSSLARQGCGFHRCIRFSKLGNACYISLYETFTF